MTCDDARRAFASGASDEVWRHVHSCDACVDALIVDTLQTPAEVSLPADFAARISTTLPPGIKAPRSMGAVVSATIALLLLASAAGTAVIWPADILRTLGVLQCSLLAALMGIELAGLVLWLGRGTRV